MNARSRPYSSAGIPRRGVSHCGHVGVDNEGDSERHRGFISSFLLLLCIQFAGAACQGICSEYRRSGGLLRLNLHALRL